MIVLPDEDSFTEGVSEYGRNHNSAVLAVEARDTPGRVRFILLVIEASQNTYQPQPRTA
jgi:hypothetical protein